MYFVTASGINRVSRILVGFIVACAAISACAPELVNCNASIAKSVRFETHPYLLLGTDTDSSSVAAAGGYSFSGTGMRAPADSLLLYRAVTNAEAIGTGLEVTVTGRQAGTGVFVSLSLVLPTPLAVHAYQIHETLDLPMRSPENNWQNFGLHPPPPVGTADVAFRTAVYDSASSTFTDKFVAKSAAGTAQLIGQIPKGYELWLDLRFTDANGVVLPVRGYAKLYGVDIGYYCID